MATTKVVRIWAMVALIGYILCTCDHRHTSNSAVKKIYHDTVFVDNSMKEKTDTVFYDSKWLRKRFETAKWKKWKNDKDGVAVEYPKFMEKLRDSGERKLHVGYHGISLLAVVYEDETEKSVTEKYEALNMGAVTKSMHENSFLLAGRMTDGKRFFEKDIKLKGRLWMYLRAEFPSELAWAADPLLRYVRDYHVAFILFAGK